MSQRTLLQFFHWYYPEGGKLWSELAERAQNLVQMGVTDIWLPPAVKAADGPHSVGYDTYDLFDLGEFDQKGSVATKYGDRAALEAGTQAARAAGLRLLYDAVLNHKMGADETERVQVRRSNPENREEIEEDAFEATAHTRFTFPGRGGKYSQFVWDAKCFSGIDTIEDPDETGVFRLVNEYGEGEWNQDVDQENGNFDYLMGANIEYRNHAVYEEVKFWGRWLAEQVPVDGFRLDAVKHIPAWFIRDWVGHMRDTVSQDLFVVAEYWNPDLDALETYLERVDQQLTLFDVALHLNFHDAARAHGDYDLRQIFDGSLVSVLPDRAVTIVDNHDTQPLQALEAPVEPWFKPIAYALILLREGGTPCAFYPDLFGASYADTGGDGETHQIELPPVAGLPKLLEARQRFAHGPQTDVFDDANLIAFVRHGTQDAPGCVVVISNAGEGAKPVELGPDHAGAVFVDWLGNRQDDVTAGDNGQAEFPVNGESVSVWVRKDC